MLVIPLSFGFFSSGRLLHGRSLSSGGRNAALDGAKMMLGEMAQTGERAHVFDEPEISVQQPSDESLLQAYIDGDRAAFQQLMSRYSNELLHFLTRFLGSRTAAEDVFQETFLQVHTSAETFDPTRRFKPWLFTIAANKGRDHHRKQNRRQEMSLSASIGPDGEGQRFVDLMEAELPTPDGPILDAERSRLVKEVLDSMPSHLREIVLLSYFQRLSYNQIAETLEIPLGTVKSRLHAAVASFASAWKAARSRDSVHGRTEHESGNDDL